MGTLIRQCLVVFFPFLVGFEETRLGEKFADVDDGFFGLGEIEFVRDRRYSSFCARHGQTSRPRGHIQHHRNIGLGTWFWNQSTQQVGPQLSGLLSWIDVILIQLAVIQLK